MMVPYLQLDRQTELSGAAVREAIDRVQRSGWFILGPEVEAFEEEFARYCGVAHCIGVANGLDALELALRAHGIGPGDDVLVPSNTYIATWLAVSAVGARPVPMEPDPSSMLLTRQGVERAWTGSTRAVLVVHLFGACVDVDSIVEIAGPKGAVVLADAAQAHGASRDGRRAGSLAVTEAFSFYPTKNLGALGDAGAVLTRDAGVADQLRLLRNYGSRIKYQNEVVGRNSRLDEVQAAVLRAKLPLLEQHNLRRAAIARRYDEAFGPLGLRAGVADDPEQVWHVYNIYHPERDDLRARLGESGVGTQVFYPVPPHASGAYATAEPPLGNFPVATGHATASLALPIAPYLTDDEVDAVIGAVRRNC